MKILYVDKGLDNEGKEADGWFILKALEKGGHNVTVLPHQGSLKACLSDSYDLAIVIRGEHETMPQIRSLKAKKKVLWNWEQPGMPYLTTDKLNSFDRIFNSSHANNRWINKRTETPVKLLVQPVDPTVYRPLKVDKEVDVLYAGTYSPLRWNWIWELSKQFKVKVIGSGWGGFTEAKYGEELNLEFNRAKVLVVFPSWTSPNFKGTNITGTHYSLRNMMYLASGTRVVMPEQQQEFLTLFKGDVLDIQVYKDLDQCIERIKYYIKFFHNNGHYDEVHKHYTYDLQMEQMIKEVFE